MKKWCVFLVVLLALALVSSGAWAKDEIGLQSLKAQVRKKPVNALQYTLDGVDMWLTYLMRIVKTGNPTSLWNWQKNRVEGGFGVTLIEGFLHKKVDLVAGATVEGNELRHAFYGVEVELEWKGRLGKALSRLRPGVYWSQNKWWLGVSIALRGLSTQ